MTNANLNPKVSLGKSWFALYTKPKHEFKAANFMEQLEIEYYLPTITQVKQWSDRKKKVTEPLLKGYIFIYGNEKERLDSLQNNAVVSTVSFKGKPAKIPEWQIDNLKKLLEEDHEFFVRDMIKIGTLVKIIEGPFAGVEGIVCQGEENNQLLGVSIELLKRTVLVRLPKESIIKKLS